MILGNAHVSRAGDGVPAIANFSPGDDKSLLRRDAATSTRDACATRSFVVHAQFHSVRRASIGLMRVARRAGSHVALRPAIARTIGAVVKAIGSNELTS